MAGSVNKVTLVGRLGADPEVRYNASGTAVGNFSLATSEVWNDKEGQRQERTEWHRIVVWGKLAEIVGEYLGKGRQVYVEGRLQTRKWEDRENVTRYTTEIVAREVVFLGGRGDAPAAGGSTGGDNMGGSSTPSGGSDGGGHFDYGPPPMSDDDVPF